MTSPMELTIIENVAGDLQRHGFVPAIVFITKDQHAAIARLKMDLTSCVQAALNDDIKIFSDLAEEEGGTARLGAAAVRMTSSDEQRTLCYDCNARDSCRKNLNRDGSRPTIIRDVERLITEYRGYMACLTNAGESNRFSLREGK